MSQGREKRRTNATPVPQVVSVMLERHLAILAVLLELTENKERLLVMVAKLENILHLVALFVNFA